MTVYLLPKTWQYAWAQSRNTDGNNQSLNYPKALAIQKRPSWEAGSILANQHEAFSFKRPHRFLWWRFWLMKPCCLVYRCKLHNEELHNVYSSPSIIIIMKWRRRRWAGHVARTGEQRNAYRILVGKPAGKRTLGRTRRRWVHSIKIDFREIGWDGVDWIDLAEDRDRCRTVANTVTNFRVP
jgi:hypothetical protein